MLLGTLFLLEFSTSATSTFPPAVSLNQQPLTAISLNQHPLTTIMEKMDYYNTKTAEDEEVIRELQAAGHSIYGGLVTCLRQADFRSIIQTPRYQHANIETMVRRCGHLEFVKEMMKMNEGKYGPVPRVFTQIAWLVRLFNKYPSVKETYYDGGLKPRLITEAFHEMYETKVNMYWDGQKLLYPDLETECLARDSDCVNANYVYKIDAAGRLTVLKDRSCLDVDSETGEFMVAEGEQLIVPWGGNVNKARKTTGGNLGINEAGAENRVSNSPQETGLDGDMVSEDSPMKMEMCIR